MEFPRYTDQGFRITMQNEFITADEITRGIPEGVQPFLEVDALPLPQAFRPVVEAFWLAIGKLSLAIRFRKRANIVFAKAPFTLNLQNGQLTYIPKEGVINVHVEDIIFIDCERVALYPPWLQVATILEELIHVYMAVSDETLVSLIVCWLYDDCEFVNGQYRLCE